MLAFDLRRIQRQRIPTAEHVLAWRHDLHVIYVNTRRIATEVVYLEAVGNGAMGAFIHVPMDLDRHSSDPNLSIALAVGPAPRHTVAVWLQFPEHSQKHLVWGVEP